MLKNTKKLCALCGEHPATTKEHVPSRNLFVKPRPNNLLTVPSCKNCNNGSSKDDEYFLQFIATSISPEEHPDLPRLLKDQVFKSMKREEAMGMRKSFFKSFNEEYVTTYSGVYMGKQTVRYIEAKRILSIVEKNARALYYLEKKTPVPNSATIDVSMINPVESLDDMQERVDFFKPKKIGNDVFEYSSIIPYDCDISVGFYIKYFRYITFFVSIRK